MVLRSYFVLLVPNPTHAVVTKLSMGVLFSEYSSYSAALYNALTECIFTYYNTTQYNSITECIIT